MRNYIYKLSALLVSLSLILTVLILPIHSENTVSVSARAAALYEPKTERFIYTKNAHQRLGMASTTKIITALIAITELDPDCVITVNDEAIGIEGSSIYLERGEALTVKSLVYATMLASANDAAAALAYEISGGISEFSDKMNALANSLGLSDTHFTNPHGLDNENHYTTAHDLARLAAYALENPVFREIVSTKRQKIESSQKTRVLVNHNKLLNSFDGCIGVKTGYTKKSGRSLVSAAERDGLTLISVTIDAPDDWADHRKMLELGYSLYECRTLLKEGEYSYTLPVISGDKNEITVTNTKALSMVFERGMEKVTRDVALSRYFVAPINKGEILGYIIFKQNEREIARIPLAAKETVNKAKKKGFFSIFS